MRRLLAIALSSALLACDAPPAPTPPPAVPLRPPTPKPPAPPPRQTVKLRWRLPPEGPRTLDVEVVADPKRRSGMFDLRAIGGPKSELKLPTRTESLAVVTRRPETDQFLVAVIPTAIEGEGLVAGVRADPKKLQSLIGTVTGRTSMNENGFLGTELDASSRSLFGTALELPAQPVGVGDTWSSSVEPVWIEGGTWASDKKSHRNTYTLKSIDTQPDGTHVAVIAFTNHEDDTGHFKDKSGIPRPATFSGALDGHGEFLVEGGSWRSLEFTQSTRISGMGELELARTVKVKTVDLPAKYAELVK
ncbi:MAG: hypothetical protein JST54_00460 [Deltaproteobacteria bacterium]|nr:hypothetical protein [Deltaproteobacteria bacterium]